MKKVILFIVICAILFVGTPAKAQVSQADLTAQLEVLKQELIKSLMDQIAVLQKQITDILASQQSLQWASLGYASLSDYNQRAPQQAERDALLAKLKGVNYTLNVVSDGVKGYKIGNTFFSNLGNIGFENVSELEQLRAIAKYADEKKAESDKQAEQERQNNEKCYKDYGIKYSKCVNNRMTKYFRIWDKENNSCIKRTEEIPCGIPQA